MSGGKETVCSLCHGEIGPDVHGRAMCYGCGPDELMPPERRMDRVSRRARELPPDPGSAQPVPRSR